MLFSLFKRKPKYGTIRCNHNNYSRTIRITDGSLVIERRKCLVDGCKGKLESVYDKSK